MENKEQKPISLEMSQEEFDAYQAFKAEQAKKDAEKRIEALRGNYAAMSESFINRTIKTMTPLSKTIREKKAAVLEEFRSILHRKDVSLRPAGNAADAAISQMPFAVTRVGPAQYCGRKKRNAPPVRTVCWSSRSAARIR